MELFDMPAPETGQDRTFRATVEDHRIITVEFTVFAADENFVGDIDDPEKIARDLALLHLGGDPGDARYTNVVLISPTLPGM